GWRERGDRRRPSAEPGTARRAYWARGWRPTEEGLTSVQQQVPDHVAEAVEQCAKAAKQAAPSLAAASDKAIDAAESAMAGRLEPARVEVLSANPEDVAKAEADGMSAGLHDRLTITEQRLAGMVKQLKLLSTTPHLEREIPVKEQNGGLRLIERRRPVGGIGANYEARPNVTAVLASQPVESRSRGV